MIQGRNVEANAVKEAQDAFQARRWEAMTEEEREREREMESERVRVKELKDEEETKLMREESRWREVEQRERSRQRRESKKRMRDQQEERDDRWEPGGAGKVEVHRRGGQLSPRRQEHEAERMRRRSCQGLPKSLYWSIQQSKNDVIDSSYVGEVVFWEGLTGDVTSDQAFGRLESLIKGDAKLWVRGFYIGSAQDVVRRYRGWWDKGQWVEGHRYGWSTEKIEIVAKMEVVAICEGKAGGFLERRALDRFFWCFGCKNKARDSRGTGEGQFVVNYLYFVWW